jgi:hypothetical protein
MANQHTMQDPTKQYPKPDIPGEVIGVTGGHHLP